MGLLHDGPPRDSLPATSPSRRPPAFLFLSRPPQAGGLGLWCRWSGCAIDAPWPMIWPASGDRKSVVEGKRVSVRVVLGGRRSLKKKNKSNKHRQTIMTQTTQ